MTANASPYDPWDHADRTVLLQRCVGLESFGIQPDIADIRRGRHALAGYIYTTLELTSDDVVLDLGSGPGYIASCLAPLVKHIHCADVSPGYLALCQDETAGLNVTCHLIQFGNLSALHDHGITAIYASAVFVHFNIYDVYLYLLACHALLPEGGRLWLDYKAVTNLTITCKRFQRHAEVYKRNRSAIASVLHYHHPDTMAELIHQVGFTTSEIGDMPRPAGNALDNHIPMVLRR